MKAISKCKWEVEIIEDGRKIEWLATTNDESFIEELRSDYEDFLISDSAKKDFIEFAELNGITNYEFVEG